MTKSRGIQTPSAEVPWWEMNDERRRQRLLELSIPEPNSGCWIFTGSLIAAGYGQVTVAPFTVPNRQGRAHRLSYELFVGPIPAGYVVRHKCDNRACINPDHLCVGTVADNAADMVDRGRSAKGEGHSQARLTRDQVLLIANSTEPSKKLAARLGVAYATVDRIRWGKGWTHVTGLGPKA